MNVGASIEVIADPACQCRQDRPERAPVIAEGFARCFHNEAGIVPGGVLRIRDRVLGFFVFVVERDLVWPVRLRVTGSRFQ